MAREDAAHVGDEVGIAQLTRLTLLREARERKDSWFRLIRSPPFSESKIRVREFVLIELAHGQDGPGPA